MQKNVFWESIELDEKQTPSDKLFHLVGFICGTIAAVLLAANLIVFFAFPNAAPIMWMLVFYPVLIFTVVGIFCSSAQLLRNRYFSSIAAFTLNTIAVIAAITVVIVQAVSYKQVLIIPFIWM